MRTVIVYESMYGNTHLIAERVAGAAGRRGDVVVVPVTHATPEVIDGADLVVVGGPTHLHGMSWSTTRHTAVEDAVKKGEADPDAEGPGLRDWFHQVDHVHSVSAVAFDTRFDASPGFTGRASVGISRRLHQHGFREIADPESFLVDDQNHLLDGEAERAVQWAEAVLDRLVGGVRTETPDGEHLEQADSTRLDRA